MKTGWKQRKHSRTSSKGKKFTAGKKRYFVVARVLNKGIITTQAYETTKDNQQKLVDKLRSYFGPSAGITKTTMEIK
jgi:hypothetical protein